MAISNIDWFMREREILKELDIPSDNRNLTGMSNVLTDMKRSSGRWTIACILKYLYQDDIEALIRDTATLTLLGDKAKPTAVERFEVLSAIWPAVSELGLADDKIIALYRNKIFNNWDIYKFPMI